MVSFGLTNAPTTFKATMNDLLQLCLRHFTLVFFDDILIYSSSLTDHLQQLTLVCNLLQDHKFFAKLMKCVLQCLLLHT